MKVPMDEVDVVAILEPVRARLRACVRVCMHTLYVERWRHSSHHRTVHTNIFTQPAPTLSSSPGYSMLQDNRLNSHLTLPAGVMTVDRHVIHGSQQKWLHLLKTLCIVLVCLAKWRLWPSTLGGMEISNPGPAPAPAVASWCVNVAVSGTAGPTGWGRREGDRRKKGREKEGGRGGEGRERGEGRGGED